MHETLHFDKFEDAENMTIIFQTYSSKYSNKALWVRKWLLFFVQFLTFRQILGCWFQISQSFFPIFSLKVPKRTVLVSNLRIFIFAQNFLKLSTQNYTNKLFLVPKLKLFILQDLLSHKSESTDSNYHNFFKDLSLKLSRKQHFLSQIWAELCIFTNSWVLISNMAIIFQT